MAGHFDGCIEEMLGNIPMWRHTARCVVAANPALWTAMHGVSLDEYIKMLDELELTLINLKDKVVRREPVSGPVA